jgi:hypothetical protein
MNRIMIGLATAAGLSLCANVASADPGGYVPPGGPGGSAGLPSWASIAGPNTLLGSGDLPPGRAPDRYGLHPCLKKFFHIPNASAMGGGGYYSGPNPLGNPANWAAAGYGMGGPAYNPMGFPGPGGMGPGGMGPGCAAPYQQGYPPAMQGTLVFPYNNLIRSPRDYFMVDVNK